MQCLRKGVFFERETEEACSGEEKAGFMKATSDMSVQKET